jgi:LEA14-like dessication related protein
MNKVITCMLLAALTVLPAGCSVIFKTPQVSLKQTEIKKVDRDGVDIECRLAISNQNPFNLSMLSYRYDLKLATRPLPAAALRKN